MGIATGQSGVSLLSITSCVNAIEPRVSSKWVINVRIKANAKMVKKMERYFEIFPVHRIMNMINVRNIVQIARNIKISIYFTFCGLPMINMDNRKKSARETKIDVKSDFFNFLLSFRFRISNLA